MKEVKTHFNDPIDRSKALSGFGRKGSEVPPEVQQKVIDILIEEARRMKFNNRDIAYYMAIAKRESEFNPDAANPGGTASGVSQMQDGTWSDLGLDARNRFDARASIQAGLTYFRKLKLATQTDYGSSAGEYEPLIYHRYHYGEFSTRKNLSPKGQREKWVAKPFDELKAGAKYRDSKTVVDEAERLEAILNGPHGLVVQLNDVMGKPMKGRTVYAVTKTPKPGGPPPAAPAARAPSAPAVPAAQPAPAPAPAPPTAPAAATTTAGVTAPATVNAPATASAPAPAEPPPPTGEAPVPAPAPAQAAPPSDSDAATRDWAGYDAPPDSIEWELELRKITTDENGKLPEIVTGSQDPVVILIPRIDVEAYNEAVGKNEMPEDGNEHEIQPRDGEPVLPLPAALPEPAPAPAKPPAPAPAAAPAPARAPAPPAAPRTAAPGNVFDAAAKGGQPPAKPAPGREITFDDIRLAIKRDLGWNFVFQTSFAYIKQFQTRPKLPAAPLRDQAPAQPAPARTQVIGSSLSNKEASRPKAEAEVKTAEATAVKPAPAIGDSPWMVFAIKEQQKSGQEEVKWNKASHETDAGWKAKRNARDAAGKAEKEALKKLRDEKKKKQADQDKIAALQAEITVQQQAAAEADKAMLEIEKDFNNPDIVKYLQTTSLGRDAARKDETSWCSSYVNWCMEQAGYRGTDDAGASSWLNWGEKISEPRYGAITVVTRSAQPLLYHVGFYVGMGKKYIKDGDEAVLDKKGNDTGKRRPKRKAVDAVNLLSGNFSSRIREFADWTVNAADSPDTHLVEYRWPTAKEKR